MPVTLPPTEASLGNKVILVTDSAPVNPSAPTKAELNAMLFSQCLIYGPLAAPPTQATGAAPAKLCSKIEVQRLGRVTFPSFDVQYSYLPQETATPGADGNEMYEMLVPESTVYVYILDGLDGEATSTLATGAVVNHGFKVQVGEYREGQTGDDEFSEFSTTQALVPDGGRILHNYATPAS